MRIALPVQNRSIDALLSDSFGCSPYFLIYSTATKEAVFLNNENAEDIKNSGVKSAQAIADSGAHILITHSCGEQAARALRLAEVIIYSAADRTAQENIEAYLDEELALLTEIHDSFHIHPEEDL